MVTRYAESSDGAAGMTRHRGSSASDSSVAALLKAAPARPASAEAVSSNCMSASTSSLSPLAFVWDRARPRRRVRAECGRPHDRRDHQASRSGPRCMSMPSSSYAATALGRRVRRRWPGCRGTPTISDPRDPPERASRDRRMSGDAVSRSARRALARRHQIEATADGPNRIHRGRCCHCARRARRQAPPTSVCVRG